MNVEYKMGTVRFYVNNIKSYNNDKNLLLIKRDFKHKINIASKELLKKLEIDNDEDRNLLIKKNLELMDAATKYFYYKTLHRLFSNQSFLSSFIFTV